MPTLNRGAFFSGMIRFHRDLEIIGYNICYIIKYRPVKKKSLSYEHLVKLHANLVHDKDIIKIETNLKGVSHPFGLVSLIKKGAAINQDLFLNDEDTLALAETWGCNKDGRFISLVNEENIPKYWDENEFKRIKNLMKLYSKLSIRELNILATCRTDKTTSACIKLAKEGWLQHFTNFLDTYPKIGSPKSWDDDLHKAAVYMDQVRWKVEGYESEILKLKNKLCEKINAPYSKEIGNSINVDRKNKAILISSDYYRVLQPLTSLIRKTIEVSGLFPNGKRKKRGRNIDEYLDIIFTYLDLPDNGKKHEYIQLVHNNKENQKGSEIHEYILWLFHEFQNKYPKFIS